MLCYKYMSYERFLQSIRPSGVYLKVSRPAEFNDPYDCTGTVCGKASQHLIDTYSCAFQQVLNPLKLDLCVKVESRRLFDGMYRVLSFCDSSVSASANEMLMWSHYADNARGVRVGVEVDVGRFTIGAVEYKGHIPRLDLGKVRDWELSDKEIRRFVKACLLTKHRVWKYEQERRVLFDVNDSALKPLSICDARESVATATLVWTPDKAVVKEVCLGSEFLQNVGGYDAVDSYLKGLLESDYNFEVLAAIKKSHYGYDIRHHSAWYGNRCEMLKHA